jgi:hypothetical protein
MGLNRGVTLTQEDSGVMRVKFELYCLNWRWEMKRFLLTTLVQDLGKVPTPSHNPCEHAKCCHCASS